MNRGPTDVFNSRQPHCGIHPYPRQPIRHAFAAGCRDADHLQLGVDAMRVFDGEIGVESQVRQQVAFVEQYHIGRAEHAGYLSGLSSPSVTANGCVPFRAMMVFTSKVVLPEPGLGIRLSAKIPCADK